MMNRRDRRPDTPRKKPDTAAVVKLSQLRRRDRESSEPGQGEQNQPELEPRRTEEELCRLPEKDRASTEQTLS